MPRRKVLKTTKCAAHGDACALAGGSKYVSEFCEPATEPTRQELELRQLLEEASGSQPTELKASRPAERDAQYRALLAQAQADADVREAALLAGGVA